jgi:RNA polymerase sigma-70 factor, ECF subfamily
MDKTNGTNAVLIADCIEGKATAWDAFAKHYQPMIVKWCQRRGLREATTLDIVQETLISVHRSLAAFESTPGAGAFRAWLKTIVFRRILDHRRRLKGEPEGRGGSTILRSLQSVAESYSNSGSNRGEYSARIQSIIEAIAGQHSERAWQVFIRSVVDNQRTDQVAFEFSMTEAAVRQIRSRILRQLRAAIESQNIPTQCH